MGLKEGKKGIDNTRNFALNTTGDKKPDKHFNNLKI